MSLVNKMKKKIFFFFKMKNLKWKLSLKTTICVYNISIRKLGIFVIMEFHFED